MICTTPFCRSFTGQAPDFIHRSVICWQRARLALFEDMALCLHHSNGQGWGNRRLLRGSWHFVRVTEKRKQQEGEREGQKMKFAESRSGSGGVQRCETVRELFKTAVPPWWRARPAVAVCNLWLERLSVHLSEAPDCWCSVLWYWSLRGCRARPVRHV